MDPFSIVIGVASLLQISAQLSKYVKCVLETAASFEGNIGLLLREIEDLESVNKSIEQLYRRESGDDSYRQQEPLRGDLTHWENTLKILEDCSETVNRLQTVLTNIIGKGGTGHRDGFKRKFKLQAKESELDEIRSKLSAYRVRLNVSLTLLSLLYTQRGSEESQLLGFKLHRQIAALQSRTSRAEDDTTLSLSSVAAVASELRLNKHFDPPKTVSSIYTGRKEYLAELKQAFDSSHSLPEYSPVHKRFVVYGLGGSGKTQFCCKFASDNRQRFWGVFTIDASSPENAKQSFISIAKACGADPNERAAKSWLSSSDRPWLLVIDNADDTDLDIEKYFPDGEHGLTLITTRNPSVKMHGTIGRCYYHFDRLNEAEASELLLRAADHKPRTDPIMHLALKITRKLGALPLALIHAGNAIKAKYCNLSNYVEYYDRSWQLIRHSQGTDQEDDDDSEYIKVYASYEIVFRGLEAMKSQRYRDAVQLLKLFSFFHHENTPFEVLVAAAKHPRMQKEADAQAAKRVESSWTSYFNLSWRGHLENIGAWFLKKHIYLRYPEVVPTYLRDADLLPDSEDCSVRLRGALHLLTQLSLITYYESSDSFSMHPLVHTWVRERPHMKTHDQAVWCEAALQTLSRCILLPPLNTSVDPDGNLARRLVPHITAVTNSQQNIERQFERNRTTRKGLYSTVKSVVTPWRAMFLAKCALVYAESGLWVEAEDSLRIVMEFNTGLLGADHPRTERVTLAVSDLLWQQCRVNEAADLKEQVLQRNLKALGQDHPRTLSLMAKLGEDRRQQGRFAESIDLLTKAINGMRAQLPTTDPERYHVIERLGVTLRVCYCFDDSRKYLEQAVEGMKLCASEEDIRTLVTTEELALTYKELGTVLMSSNEVLARTYLETALEQANFVVEQRKKQLGERQPFTWMAQGTLGRVQAALGNVAEADAIFSTVLPVAARHFGDDHLVIMNHKTQHAKIMMQQGRYRAAEALLLDVSRPSKYKTASSTGDHPDRWDALWTLVKCYQIQGQIAASLATCGVLAKAVSAIQEGMNQTEISSTFWRMVLDKRAELEALGHGDAYQQPAKTL